MKATSLGRMKERREIAAEDRNASWQHIPGRYEDFVQNIE